MAQKLQHYRLGDTPTQDECDRLGVLRKDQLVTSWSPPQCDGEFVAAKRTHEFRAPRKGEWYLSGATPLAFRAHNDLSTEYRIMRLVVLESYTKVQIREIRS